MLELSLVVCLRMLSLVVCLRMLSLLLLVGAEDPGLILVGARQVFATVDGSYMLGLGDNTVVELNNQVGRVLGLDPGVNWNASTIRGLSDDMLVTLGLLAVVGNFTSGKASSWQQPCRVVMDPETGLLQVADLRNTTDQVLTVLVLVLCLVQLKQLLENWRKEEKKE